MAKMIDIMPEYHGEAKLWSAIEQFLPNDIIAYNNREINGREFDFCLISERYGAIIIEVKGWLFDKINVLGVDNIMIEGYTEPQRSPKKQARAYRFALLNKIKEKYNVSPLVFDMVCYPFISKEEYEVSRLNTISEEAFTLFKEDIEDQNKFLKKLDEAYNKQKNIPHEDFNSALICNIRKDWEPDFVEESVEKKYDISTYYSAIYIIKDLCDEVVLQNIVTEYFCGIKQIVFLSDLNLFYSLIDEFNIEFKKHNILPSKNRLEIGYSPIEMHSNKDFKTFNLEIYFVPDLKSICGENQKYIEGRIKADDKKILRKLSDITAFNFEQFLVEHANENSNILVEAGAGTGKTYSMVSRVAFLCNKEFNSISNIADDLAMMTFTNEAATNMKKRLKQMFVNYFILTSNPKYLKFIEDVDRAHISTIHSFAIDIVRKSSLYTGLGTNLKITSNEYLREKIYDKYLSDYLKKKENENSNFANELPVPVYELKKKLMGISDRLLTKSVDMAKIKLSDMGDVSEEAIPYFNDMIIAVSIPSEKEYLSTLHEVNNFDLKESIISLNGILDEMIDQLKKFKFKYIFIDEFQDTDDAQIAAFQKIQKAMQQECYLFVVGDLKQSIYRFRGAKLSAFEQLKNGALYEWDNYSLTRNYRTDSRLLKRYERIFSTMGNNGYLPYAEKDRLSSDVLTDGTEDNLLVSIPCHGKDEEVFFEMFFDILKKQENILSKLMENKKLNKEERTIAVLVRSNWQVDRIVTEAKFNGINVETKSGGDLFQLESTADLYKLVMAMTNSRSPIYLINLLNSNYIDLKLDYSLYSGVGEEDKITDMTRILDEYFMLHMKKTWNQVVSEAFSQPILFVLKQVYDALKPWKKYSKRVSMQKFYMANYEYLIEKIIKYSKIDSLTLNQIAEWLRINILTGQQQLSRPIDDNDEGIRIICTTIHKSKGLEYGTVIMPYTYEDISDTRKVKLDANYSENYLAYLAAFENENKIIIKNSNYDFAVETGEQISEECRILYVAMTRAIRNFIWINNIDAKPSISWGSLMEE